ncbi:hypothetical protein D4R47_01035 [archaeon]|nr:MAG: hypothetical protein D4R47_01035 [archaeon]
MVSETIFLTEEGYKRMQQELEQANQTLYEELPQKLKHSKLSGGDLRENKEYIYLQSEQQYYEREVRRLTGVLEAAEIIPEDEISGEEIVIGSSFILQDLGSVESGSFTLVSTAEVDLEKGRISVASPVGGALLGRRKGDELSVELPGGAVRFVVLAIKKER